MEFRPLVSIIVPIYGVEQYIERCAHSLFSQTYSNIEYIFVNDRTTDNSMGILSSVIELYPTRKPTCKIINHEVNLGLSGARDTGISNITGDYVMHVDSDDYLELNAVETLVSVALASESDVVVGGSYNDKGNNRTINHINEKLDKEELIVDILMLRVAPSIWGKLYSSKLYSTDKDTRPIIGVNHGEDYATVPRLLYYANKVSYIDLPLYNYVQYNTTSYTKNFKSRSMQDLLNATSKLQSFFCGKLDEEILGCSALRVKLSIFKCLNIDLYESARHIYPYETKKYFNKMSISDRVLLVLISLGLYKLAKSYIRLGYCLKGI